MDIASGQPVFLSLSFILWRKECMVTFLSVTVLRRRFISITEQVSPPRSLAKRGKSGASGSCPAARADRCRRASGDSGTERCEERVFSVRHGVGMIWTQPCSRSQSLTLRPDISETLAPVSARVTNRASAIGSRSEEHTSELQSHSEISYAVFCLKKKNKKQKKKQKTIPHNNK